MSGCPWCRIKNESQGADPFPTREEIEFGPVAGTKVAQTPLVASAGAAPAIAVAQNKIHVASKPMAAVGPAPSALNLPPKLGRSQSPPMLWLGAVIALIVLAVGWAAIRPRHATSIRGMEAAAPKTAAILPASPAASSLGSVDSARSAAGADASRRAIAAQTLLDGVTQTIVASQKRALTPAQAALLRSRMAEQCQSAEKECDTAIGEDKNCQKAWLQRIRGYRLLARQSQAEEASREATIIFASDPEMVLKLATSQSAS